MLRVVILALAITSATSFPSFASAVEWCGTLYNKFGVFLRDSITVTIGKPTLKPSPPPSFGEYHKFLQCSDNEDSPTSLSELSFSPDLLAQRVRSFNDNRQVQCLECELSGTPKTVLCYNSNALTDELPTWTCQGRFPNENFGLLSAKVYCEMRRATVSRALCTKADSCLVVVTPYLRQSSISAIGAAVSILLAGGFVCAVYFYRRYKKRRQTGKSKSGTQSSTGNVTKCTTTTTSTLPMPTGVLQISSTIEEHSTTCVSDRSLASQRPWLPPLPPPPSGQPQLALLPLAARRPSPQPRPALLRPTAQPTLLQPPQPRLALLPSSPPPPPSRFPLPLLAAPRPSLLPLPHNTMDLCMKFRDLESRLENDKSSGRGGR